MHIFLKKKRTHWPLVAMFLPTYMYIFGNSQQTKINTCRLIISFVTLTSTFVDNPDKESWAWMYKEY